MCSVAWSLAGCLRSLAMNSFWNRRRLLRARWLLELWRGLVGSRRLVAGQVFFHVEKVATHGTASLIGVTLCDSGEDGLMVFQRRSLMLMQPRTLAQAVIHGSKHARP